MDHPSNVVDLADRIDDVLPQTQCRRCGYDGCRPYAEAVAQGEAIDRCPPGGGSLLATLAALTGRSMPAGEAIACPPEDLRLARVIEPDCIGCTLCIQACPVDAIVGAAKRMHTVVAALCTGCELCVPVCPVDCIDMIPAPRAWTSADAQAARSRFLARNRRLASDRETARPRTVDARAVNADPVELDAAERLAFVSAARGRARVRRREHAAKTGRH